MRYVRPEWPFSMFFNGLDGIGIYDFLFQKPLLHSVNWTFLFPLLDLLGISIGCPRIPFRAPPPAIRFSLYQRRSFSGTSILHSFLAGLINGNQTIPIHYHPRKPKGNQVGVVTSVNSGRAGFLGADMIRPIDNMPRVEEYVREFH